jgi:hypothetical protein
MLHKFIVICKKLSCNSTFIRIYYSLEYIHAHIYYNYKDNKKNPLKGNGQISRQGGLSVRLYSFGMQNILCFFPAAPYGVIDSTPARFYNFP